MKDREKDLDKALKKQEILVKDEKVWSYTYEDHISSIIKRSQKEGVFDDLVGKGKPLQMDKSLSYNPERQLYKTMKDNHVMPRWIELSKEIDALKEKLHTCIEQEEVAAMIEMINKKIHEYNLTCPPSAQKLKISKPG
ncbi:DUF1992 domain-containing protein [Bacillus sp. 166amftsu]|uniref:DnaJ family domain-containing protein n=1 Tax=Bacillus sp. 166amftsu TaxID=1761753 RepID=UPI00089865DF|nr:DUF1992 domain-containing protein [Bacillus sp. 166amftsu]SDZ44938.1 protein of unknown function [Bacillus sp. 166amftsu]